MTEARIPARFSLCTASTISAAVIPLWTRRRTSSLPLSRPR